MPWCQDGHEMDAEDRFCSVCGKTLVTRCRNHHEIKVTPNLGGGTPIRPNHCTVCGAAYPWAGRTPAG